MLVLGLDCGLSNMGWALVELLARGEKPLALGTWRTTASDAKSVAGADDLVRRGRELAAQLDDVVCGYQPTVLCAERFSTVVAPRKGKGRGKFQPGTTDEGGFSVNVHNTTLLAWSWGIVTAVAARHQIPVRTCTPQGIKKALTGRGNAKKPEVQVALERRYGPLVFEGLSLGDKGHAADALGAIVALLETDVVQLGRRQAVERERARATAEAVGA